MSWTGASAYASGSFGTWLERGPRIRGVLPRAEGAAYLGLAGCAAVSS